jgi:hypothetical protein
LVLDNRLFFAPCTGNKTHPQPVQLVVEVVDDIEGALVVCHLEDDVMQAVVSHGSSRQVLCFSGVFHWIIRFRSAHSSSFWHLAALRAVMLSITS